LRSTLTEGKNISFSYIFFFHILSAIHCNDFLEEKLRKREAIRRAKSQKLLEKENLGREEQNVNSSIQEPVEVENVKRQILSEETQRDQTVRIAISNDKSEERQEAERKREEERRREEERKREEPEKQEEESQRRKEQIKQQLYGVCLLLHRVSKPFESC
jgi:hypothetical protein